MTPELSDGFVVPHQPVLFESPAAHWMMVYDEHRVGLYRRAIEQTVRRGDVVVDIGTGTGLLAFLAARAGARRVHAIERSPTVLGWAERLARANGLEDRITFHRGDSRDVALEERADVVVSELIGYLAFEEGIVATLLDARERLLKPHGRVIPRSVTLHAAPVCERTAYASCIDGWRPAYGLDYSPMREQALRSCYLTYLEPGDLLAGPQPAFAADFDKGLAPEGRARCRFAATRPGTVNGIGLWFGAELSEDVELRSSPEDRTHWGQAFVPVPEPIAVAPGDRLWADLELKLPGGAGDPCELAVRVGKGASPATRVLT